MVIAALSSCTPALPRSRGWISEELAIRTGGNLRTSTERAFQVPTGIRVDDGLTTDEAVALALWNNAGFQADLTQLGVARADLADAGVLPNPVATLLFPLGTKQLELTARLALGGLWQRPKRIAAARGDASRIAEQLVQRGLDLARDVELGCARVTLADVALVLARDASALWVKIGEIAAARERAGDASEIEVQAVRADALSAQAAAEQAESELALARSELETLIGAPPGFTTTLAPRPPTPAGDLGSWLAGIERRPDLRAARAAVDAAGERAGLERRQIVALTGIFDLNGSPLEAGPGIDVALPIFDRRQGGRIRARAELERAHWAHLALHRQIVREVSDAHVRLVRATAQVASYRDAIVQARSTARQLAQQAFEQGEASFLGVLEATRSLVDARRRLADFEAEVSRAAAELTRATGGRHAP